ncbi:Arabinose efflux permease [Rubrobacter radiotolerans]|uniref:Arabinose efflux permease n=1 Tax=Rubrobacter radiotolerans TaxID=42256 RepID=A0A023X3Y0_RUBRA|nr:MFS transporter [Rubrobacter radiotolerans]AHY47172.1 Arabinose efflux permease [Rubrobacter radiotolerans]MDX5894577.1 MFS transporter [Rubrobacter radiotolerans]SMC06299.1 Predicted arabinose efflux permease, MFS family [Rubrobacter radiotolerans DSM 5868]
MRKLLILACSIVLVDTVFYSALVPLIPYFTSELGLSKLEVGLLNGSFGAGVLAGSLPGGYLVARFGPKAAALFGFALFSLASLAFAFAGTEWALIGARFGEGFASAFSWIAAFTWLVAAVPDGRRGQAIGTLISAAVVGALLGPIVGSAASIVGISATFVGVAVLGALIGTWVLFTPAPPPEPYRPFFSMLLGVFRPRLALGMWFILLSPLLFGAPLVLAPLALDASGWGALAIGGVFLAAAAFEATAQPFIGRWSDRAGYRVPLAVGLAGSISLLFLLAWGPGAAAVSAFVVLAAVFFNGSVTLGTALFSKEAEGFGVDQAIVFAATNVAWATGSALGAPLAGSLADAGGDGLAYLALAAVCGLTLVALRRVKLR